MNLKWLPALALATQLNASVLNEATLDSKLNSSFLDECRIIPYVGPDGQTHNPHGWVSLYGSLNGGATFFTDLFTNEDTSTVNVSWDFIANGYRMKWIVAVGDETKLFRVGRNFQTFASGNVTMPNGVEVLDFYGTSPYATPDSGTTFSLLFLSLFGLLLYDKKTVS